MDSYLLRGILIGRLFGVPAGAVGVLTVQRTIKYGTRAGLVTGLGSSVADFCYACIGAFGLTLISDFLLNHQRVIHILGVFLILAAGTQLLFGKETGEQKESLTTGSIRLFLPLPWGLRTLRQY